MAIRVATVADVAAIARVHVESWRTTYKDIVPADFLANLTYAQREPLWREVLSKPASTGLVYVAEDAPGNTVGFASGGPERSRDPVYSGEVYAIYLLESWQRQGLGRQLTVTLVRQLVQAGLTSLLVWVLAENRSRRFYEALGGQQVRQQPVTIGGAELIEVAYGWLDARTIINAPERSRRLPGAQANSMTSLLAATMDIADDYWAADLGCSRTVGAGLDRTPRRVYISASGWWP